jgi:hypothetical protein
MSEYRKLYDKVLTEPEFRIRLAADPAEALKSIGIDPTPEILSGVNEALAAIKALQEDFGADITDEACIT